MVVPAGLQFQWWWTFRKRIGWGCCLSRVCNSLYKSPPTQWDMVHLITVGKCEMLPLLPPDLLHLLTKSCMPSLSVSVWNKFNFHHHKTAFCYLLQHFSCWDAFWLCWSKSHWALEVHIGCDSAWRILHYVMSNSLWWSNIHLHRLGVPDSLTS